MNMRSTVFFSLYSVPFLGFFPCFSLSPFIRLVWARLPLILFQYFYGSGRTICLCGGLVSVSAFSNESLIFLEFISSSR